MGKLCQTVDWTWGTWELAVLLSKIQMIVVISGDCNTNHCKVTGLDIFAVRHPKLFNLVISRLGLVTDGTEQVVLNQNQMMADVRSLSVLKCTPRMFSTF